MFGKKKEVILQPEFVFECDVVCKNCGFKWTEEFEKGWQVIEDKNNKALILDKNKRTHKIKCVVCNFEEIDVLERRPTKQI